MQWKYKNRTEEIIDKYELDYNYIGIRVQEEAFELGNMDHVSKVWIDGDETAEELNGYALLILIKLMVPIVILAIIWL